MSPPIMSSLFAIREHIHNTMHFQVLSNERRRIVNHGFETMLCYRAPYLWQNYRQNINLLDNFKKKAKK